MPRRALLGVVLAVAAVALAAAVLRPRDPAAQALAAQLAPVDAGAEGFGLRAGTRLGTAMRGRAWILSSPAHPEGIDLFTALPDAALGEERSVLPEELAPTLARLRGLRWDAAAGGWVDPAGSRPLVPLVEVAEALGAACAAPADARAVVDLLAGTPAPGAPSAAERLLVQGEAPPRLRFVPFAGRHGMMVDLNRPPPYRGIERPYRGLLMRFEAPGWPGEWRVVELRAAGY